MKNVSILILSLLLQVTVTAQWQNIGGPNKARVIDIAQSGNRLYALTAISLQYSTDDGNTWRIIKGSNNLGLLLRLAVDGNTIYLMNSNYYNNVENIYVTENDGQNWRKIDFISNEVGFNSNLSYFKAFNDTLVFQVNNHLFVSDDKGKTQSAKKEISNFWERNLVKFKGQYFYVDNDKVVKTTNFKEFEIIPPPNDSLSKTTIFRNESELFIQFNNKANYKNSKIYKYTNDTFELYHIGYPFDVGFNDLKYDGPVIYNNARFSNNGGISWEVFNFINEFTEYPDIKCVYINNGVYYSGINAQIYRKDSINGIQKNITGNIVSDPNYIEVFKDKVISYSHLYSGFNLNTNKWDKYNPSLRYTRSAYYGQNKFISISNNLSNYDSLLMIQNQQGDTLEIMASPKKNSFELTEIYSLNDLLFITTFDSILISNDKGLSWSSLPFDDTYGFQGTYANGYYTFNNIYSNDNKPVYISSDGKNWNQINATGLPTGLPIDISTTDENGIIYLMCRNDKIYKQNTISKAFEEILHPLGKNFMYSYKIQPFNIYGRILMMGIAGKGMYISYDDGENWETFNEGLENLNITSISFDEEYLYIGTFCHVYKRPVSDLNAKSYTGLVFEDTNNNGNMENDEKRLAHLKIKTSKNDIITESNEFGQFSIYSREIPGNTIDVIPPLYAQSTTGPLTLNSANNNNIGVYFNPNINDVGLKLLLQSGVTRPGFTSTYEIVLYNNSYRKLNYQIILNYDTRLTFLNAAIMPDMVNQGELIWNNLNIEKLGQIIIGLSFKLDANISIGTSLDFRACIEIYNQQDDNPDDNCFEDQVTVVNSFDPNDKAVQPATNIPFTPAIKRQLLYTIRFQNTGNFPAEFVRIIDTLDSDLDLTSLKILSTSHKVEWNMREKRVLNLYFPAINLIDSATSETLSHGFITYSINMENEVKPGDEINNTAHIYFDYNPPVITNTTTNAIITPLKLKDGETINGLKISPIPAHNSIQLSVSSGRISSYSIYDQVGHEISGKITFIEKDCVLNIENLIPGIYLLKSEINGKHYVSKFIKM